uniref:Uncharacterized protein n=1 Tax=viral metagenome TaxID=1070528 RepID=A0A6C0DJU8_9ZZZZ
MSFVPPSWDAVNGHYVINLVPALTDKMRVFIMKDTNGSTVFKDNDAVENYTDAIINNLIDEGASGNWFAKLPSHDQLLKRVKHSFSSLAQDTENAAALTTLLLTPKVVTLLWTPTYVAPSSIPQISFEESESETSSQGDEVEISESALPPVELVNDAQEAQEDYLLTRLRAAKARVEAEQIRMQYFEATGRMPPDSEDEDE